MVCETSDGDMARRRRQAVVAGHVGDVEAARHLLDDPEAEVRSIALGALARAGDLRPADLIAAVTDAAPAVRRRAAELVAAHAEDPDDPARGVSLLDLLVDPDDSVVEVAAWACGERNPPEEGAVQPLVALATGHDDALVREAAVAALGSIGDQSGLPAILAATRDKATVRRRAVIALAPFEGPEVDQALADASADRDWQVRQAAEDLSDPRVGRP